MFYSANTFKPTMILRKFVAIKQCKTAVSLHMCTRKFSYLFNKALTVFVVLSSTILKTIHQYC